MVRYSFIITGPKDAGKSTLCWQVLEYLNQLPVSKGGVITLQNDKKWFYLIAEDSKIPFEADETEEFIPIGHFHVNKANLGLTINSIQTHLDSDFLFIDEIGLLELQGSGFYPVLNSVLTREHGNVLVVRETILDKFLVQYPRAREYKTLRVEDYEISSSLNIIKKDIIKKLNDFHKT